MKQVRIGRWLPALAMCVVASMCLSVPLAAADLVVVTWTGSAGSGVWDDPGNWTGGIVPINTATTTYKVVIPTGVTVYYERDIPANIDELSIGSGARLMLLPGCSLTVQANAAIAGLIEVNGGALLAVPPAAGFSGSTGRVAVSGGGTLALASTSYSGGGLTDGSYTLFSASGAGSTLDLSKLQTLNDGWTDGTSAVRVHTIAAQASGRIDLSSLASITGPQRGEDRLDIVLNTGGSIGLQGLQTITSTGGQVRFVVSGSKLALPSLQAASRTSFDLGSQGIVNLPSLTSFSDGTFSLANGALGKAESLRNLTNATMSLSNGSVFSMPRLAQITNSTFAVSGGAALKSGGAAAYSSTGLSSAGWTYNLFTSDGAGSVLDLSSIQGLDARFNDGWGGTTVQRISATTGAYLNLSGLRTITGPVEQNDRLELVNSAGGSIDLSSLTTITSAGSGRVRFDGGFSLPSLASVSRVDFSATGGSSITAPMLATAQNSTFLVGFGSSITAGAISDLDNSTVAVSGGSQFGAIDILATSYSSTGLSSAGWTYNLFTSDGAGSVLDLSSIQSLNAGFNDGWGGTTVQRISATTGAYLEPIPQPPQMPISVLRRGGAL